MGLVGYQSTSSEQSWSKISSTKPAGFDGVMLIQLSDAFS